jgi:hypothetical protein
MKVFLDDVRPMPDGYDVHAKTAKEAIDLLSTGKVIFISLDHDLGPEEAGTGYQVAEYIEREAFYQNLPRLYWQIHSANPVGIKNMTKALENADKFWAKS